VISPLECSLDGRQITVKLSAGSLLRRLHGVASVAENTTCSYGLTPDLDQLASSYGLAVAAIDGTGEVRAVERPDHPFFVATLYQPQLNSTPSIPHPLLTAFLHAASC